MRSRLTIHATMLAMLASIRGPQPREDLSPSKHDVALPADTVCLCQHLLRSSHSTWRGRTSSSCAVPQSPSQLTDHKLKHTNVLWWLETLPWFARARAAACHSRKKKASPFGPLLVCLAASINRASLSLFLSLPQNGINTQFEARRYSLGLLPLCSDM